MTVLSHSDDKDEVETLLNRVVEATNKVLLKEAELIAASSRGNSPTGTAFQPQVPLFPGLQEEKEAFEAGKTSIITKGKLIQVPPSTESNGFTIAVFVKEVSHIAHADGFYLVNQLAFSGDKRHVIVNHLR